MQSRSEFISEACKGIYIDDRGRAKVKNTHTENLATWKLADVLDAILDNPNVVLVSTDPIRLQWRDNNKEGQQNK